MQFVVVCCSRPCLVLHTPTSHSCYVTWHIQIWCSTLTCVAVSGSVLQCAAVCCSVLQPSLLLCCSVLRPSLPRGAQDGGIHVVWYDAFKCGAVCCSVLWYTVVCCSVLQCVAVCCSRHCLVLPLYSHLYYVAWHIQVCAVWHSMLQRVAACCSRLPRAAHATVIHIIWHYFQVCCSVLQCVAVCCRVLQRVAVCCTVLQCVVVCRNVLQWPLSRTASPRVIYIL